MTTQRGRKDWMLRLSLVSLCVTTASSLMIVARGQAPWWFFLTFTVLSYWFFGYFKARRDGLKAELGAVVVNDGDDHAAFADFLISGLALAIPAALVAVAIIGKTIRLVG